MDRSIEGDASIRVGSTNSQADAFHFTYIRVPGKTLLGANEYSVKLRGHELKAIVHLFYVTYVIPFYLWLSYNFTLLNL